MICKWRFNKTFSVLAQAKLGCWLVPAIFIFSLLTHNCKALVLLKNALDEMQLLIFIKHDPCEHFFNIMGSEIRSTYKTL